MRIAAAAALLLAVAGCDRAPTAPAPKAEPPLQFEAVTLARPQVAAAGARRGERLGRVLGCAGCHGRDLTGKPWIEDPQDAILFTSNLTRAVPEYDDSALERAIRGGVRHDGSPLWDMPSELFTQLSAPDMGALIAWLRTVPPRGAPHPRIVIGPRGRQEIAAGRIKPGPQVVREDGARWPPRIAARHDWARYMVRATCAECHGLDLAGDGEPSPGSAPALAIVAGYSRDQFRHLLRTGEPVGGRTLGLMRSVARSRFVHLTDREVDAIYDYLAANAARPQ